MTYLPDVNVWVALSVANHTSHKRVALWLEKSIDSAEFAFCRVTQHGLLRLLTHPKVMKNDPRSPEDAWFIYDKWVLVTEATLKREPDGFEEVWRSLTAGRYRGNDHFTDAYLSAFAAVGGFTVATLDRKFKRHAGARVEILEP